MPLRLAVLLSGNGSTLQNFFDHIDAKCLDAKVVAVVSSRHAVRGLERASERGVPAWAVARRDHADTEAMSAAVWESLAPYRVDLVALAGYMSLLIVPPAYENRIVNVHPALIPAFCGQGMYGRHVHEAVLTYGAKVTGATVHFVDNHYDNGPIIAQATVPVCDDDTADSLGARVQACERTLYPAAIQAIAEDRVRVEGRRVRVAPKAAGPSGALA